jgi:hypothetical protein
MKKSTFGYSKKKVRNTIDWKKYHENIPGAGHYQTNTMYQAGKPKGSKFSKSKRNLIYF